MPLPKGQLGEEAAQLIGSLLVAQLWAAVQGRSRLPQAKRSLFLAYLDEAKDFLNLPIAVSDMLAEARGLGLGLTLATQHLGQFPKELRDAALANARTKIAFRLPHDDATTLHRLVGSSLSVDDLKRLPAYEFVLHSDATGFEVTTTGTTLPLPAGTGRAGRIRYQSRQRWAMPIEDIDGALMRRQQLEDGGGRRGRRLGPRPLDDGPSSGDAA